MFGRVQGPLDHHDLDILQGKYDIWVNSVEIIPFWGLFQLVPVVSFHLVFFLLLEIS